MTEEEWRSILSGRDWRKALPYAPIVAVVIVIIAALGMDLAYGGPSKPQLDNAAPPPEALRATIEALPVSPTPYVALPTATPTAPPLQDDANPTMLTRDQQRMQDAVTIATALEEYKDEEGEYPSNGGGIQSLCSYVDLDAGCQLKDYLDPLPEDPLGDAAKNGYWYSSDGKTYTIVAGMELTSSATPGQCEKRFKDHTRKTNLFCLKGPPTTGP